MSCSAFGVDLDGRSRQIDVVGQHIASSIAALDRGDANAAFYAASDACHAAPERPEAYYARGQACAALGNHPEAERSFAQAVRLKPGWADAWVNCGLALYAQGKVEPAKRVMQAALRIQPDHPAATSNLAALLRVTGHHEASEQMLDAALRHDSDNAAARLNRVAELLQDGQASEALALLDAATPPNSPALARHWHLQRSLALVALGRPGDARDALDALEPFGPVPPELEPLRQWRLVLIADAEGRHEDAAAAADSMEAALGAMGPAAVPEHRVMAHYDLAKFWSGRGERGRAFAHWIAGHRLLAPSQPFSREAAAAFDEAAIAAFTPTRFAAGPRATNGDQAPVFIVGMPRSGTTLCEQIIAAHGQAHGAGERPALEQLFLRLSGGMTPDGVERIAALSQDELDAAVTAYLADLHALAPGAARIVDKMPGNYRFVWLIALLFPKARIIHCTRDPRDIGLSIFTFRFHGDHGYAHDLADLGWTIAQQERSMAHWKAVSPNPVLTVRLQDWVEDFDGTLARVLAHLDLPFDPNCARFHEGEGRVRTASRAQVRQTVNARGLGRWRAYEQELGPLIEELERSGSAPDARATPAAASLPAAALHILRPDDPQRSLGLAVSYLMTRLEFAALPFGSWSQVLAGQVRRGHYAFAVDGSGRMRGFVGWALATREHAEAWVEGRRELSFDEALAGDCIVFNIWAADDRATHRFMVDQARHLVERKTTLFWKRHYPDGRTRPVRLRVSSAVTGHIRRAAARDARRGGDAALSQSFTALPLGEAPPFETVLP